MAAFQFPENPANGDTITNSSTGLTYVYQNPPGKWEVQMQSDSTDYVDVAGDTMTGLLAFSMSSGDSINVNGGNFKVGYNGAVNMKSGYTLTDGNIAVNKGNITATQGAPNAAGTFPDNGGLFAKTSDGVINFAAYPNGNVTAAGEFDLGSTLKLGGPIDFSTTAADKVFRGYNNNDAAFVFKLGVADTGSSAQEQLKITQTGTIIQGGLDVEGINGQYAAQFKGDLYLDNSSCTINAFGASNASLQIYVGQTAGTTSRQVALYEGNAFIFSDVSMSKTLDISGALTVHSASSFSGGLTVNSGSTILKGNSTVQGTATFQGLISSSAATVGKFSRGGNKFFDIQDTLLIYGLKSGGTRPSWEAIKIGIDPNNENFSAMTIGKRMYYSGGYVYMDGSVRTYVNTGTWDFRDNDTNNNILWSVSAGGVSVAADLNVGGDIDVSGTLSVNGNPVANSSDLSQYVLTSTANSTYLRDGFMSRDTLIFRTGGTTKNPFKITNDVGGATLLRVDASAGSNGPVIFASDNGTHQEFSVGGLITARFEYEKYTLFGTGSVQYTATDAHYFKGGINIQRTGGTPIIVISNGGKMTVERVGNNSAGFTLKGRTSDGTEDGDLLSAYHNGGSVTDAINYNGRTDAASNLQTKASVEGISSASVTSFKSVLHTAVNNSVDFASLKAALLAVLS